MFLKKETRDISPCVVQTKPSKKCPDHDEQSPHKRFVAAYGAKLKAVETMQNVSTAFTLVNISLTYLV